MATCRPPGERSPLIAGRVPAGDDGMHGERFAGVAHQGSDVSLGHPRSHAANHAEDRLADAQGGQGEGGDLVRPVTAAETVSRIHEHGGHIDRVRPSDAAQAFDDQRGCPAGRLGSSLSAAVRYFQPTTPTWSAEARPRLPRTRSRRGVDSRGCP